jgi:hypothetical protein
VTVKCEAKIGNVIRKASLLVINLKMCGFLVRGVVTKDEAICFVRVDLNVVFL